MKIATTPIIDLLIGRKTLKKILKSLRPSMMVNKIKKLFPELKEESDVVSKNDSILTAESTFNQMLSNIKDFKQGKESLKSK